VLKGEEVVVPIDGSAQPVAHGLIAMPQTPFLGADGRSLLVDMP